EVVRRLQEAVNKVPEAARARAAAAAAREPAAESRGALNRLIHRMTGQSTPLREVTERRAPELSAAPQRRLDPDEQARIDVPAFLRRQAN
ncbi:MAG: cell division protein FtsZ, partial [Alphaproteobacteria bacterium]